MDNDKTAVLLMRENPANPIDPYRMIETGAWQTLPAIESCKR